MIYLNSSALRMGQHITTLSGIALATLVFAHSIDARAATIVREVTIDAPPSTVWNAIRDVGAVDRRLLPNLVTSDDTKTAFGR